MSEGEWIQARVATKKNTPPKNTSKKSTNATKKHIAPVIRKRQTPDISNSVGNSDLLGKNSHFNLHPAENLELIKNALDSHINVKAHQTAIDASLEVPVEASLRAPVEALNVSLQKPIETSPETPIKEFIEISLTRVAQPEQNNITNSRSDSQRCVNSRESNESPINISINWANHLTDSINSELIDKKYKRYADSYIDPSHIIPVILPKRRPPPSLFDKSYNLIYNHDDNCWDKEIEPPITDLDRRFDAYFESIAIKETHGYRMDDWTPSLSYDSDECADEDYYSDGEMISNLDYDTHI